MIKSPDFHQWSKFVSLVAISEPALAGARRGDPCAKQATGDSVKISTNSGQIKWLGIYAGVLAIALAGCQAGERIGGPLVMEIDSSSPISVLSAINENAQKCWFRSKDSAFRSLSVIPELDTRAGNPRLLVVERGKATGLPKLVIEASGKPVKITTYGPLTGNRLSARINYDIIDWSGGRDGC